MIKVTFTIAKGSDWLHENLEDLAISLDKNLRKRNQGAAKGEFKDKFFIIKVHGCPMDILKPYIDAFERSQRCGEQSFIINIDEFYDNDDPTG
jgi:hypothetical protein